MYRVRQSHAKSITATFGSEIPDIDQPNLRGLSRLEFDAATHDFRIESRAADVLTQFIDDEKVELGEGNPRHRRPGDLQAGFVHGDNFRGACRAQSGDLMEFIFHDGYSGQNSSAREHLCG